MCVYVCTRACVVSSPLYPVFNLAQSGAAAEAGGRGHQVLQRVAVMSFFLPKEQQQRERLTEQLCTSHLKTYYACD